MNGAIRNDDLGDLRERQRLVSLIGIEYVVEHVGVQFCMFGSIDLVDAQLPWNSWSKLKLLTVESETSLE